MVGMTTTLPPGGGAGSAPDPAASLAGLRAAFDPVPGYLNTASRGLPPRVAVAALAEDLRAWHEGRAAPPDYDDPVALSRAAYARLVGVDPVGVAVGSQVSAMLAPVAASVPDGGRVVLPVGDFTSVVFPFLVQRDRRVRVDQVPLAELAEHLDDDTDLVAFSLVQSADGVLADVDAITRACSRHDVLSVCDTTQAVGWLPVRAAGFDVTVCSAYKWLSCPRGAAFTTVAEPVLDRLRPVAAGWFAGERVWESIYGPDMELAGSARRLDVSPAWSAWVGASVTLPLFADSDPAARRAHAVALASRVRRAAGTAETGSAIVALPDPDGRVAQRLTDAGCRYAMRAGQVRLAFHVTNDDDDVERVLAAL